MIYVISSLLLGLCSWIIPLIKINKKSQIYKSILSFISCLLSVYFQILLMKSYGDEWPPIIDAIEALTFVVPVLMIGTVASNLISSFYYRK